MEWCCLPHTKKLLSKWPHFWACSSKESQRRRQTKYNKPLLEGERRGIRWIQKWHPHQSSSCAWQDKQHGGHASSNHETNGKKIRIIVAWWSRSLYPAVSWLWPELMCMVIYEFLVSFLFRFSRSTGSGWKITAQKVFGCLKLWCYLS